MCGIAGIFNLQSSAIVEQRDLERMIATLPHRGPDASGTSVCAAGVGLGHTRLSIQDLSPEANQPFDSSDGRLSITYNGEIFNFVELRDELAARGRRFRTQCDTEVLLEAYAEWGDDFVGRLNGMWAFAIYDRRSDRLFCSRDRFGIKPFVYAHHEGRLLFASEIKALLEVAPALATPDYADLSMALRATTGSWRMGTCFEAIHRVPPAHNLIATREGITLQRYWDYPEGVDDSIGMEEAAGRFRELLVDAIRLRMRSDVPVGSTLSSGVDSSAIVCLLRSFSNSPLETFTAAYEGEPFDESPRAKRLADEMNLNANMVPSLTGDFLAKLGQCVHHLEGPERSPAVLPLWNIMHAARQKVTCLLEGQGADELLAGYVEPCFPHAIGDRLRRGAIADAGRVLSAEIEQLGVARVSMWTARTLLPRGQEWFTALRGDRRVYAGPLAAAYAPDRPVTKTGATDSLGQELRRQHQQGLVALLHYGDAISMAHSVETRLPFMDYRLVEFAFRLPGHLKFRPGESKAILRRAVRKDVPADILAEQKKLAFVTPIRRWFQERPEETVHPVLLSDACRKRGIFDPAALQRALERHRSGRVDLSQQIFRWLTAELWFQEFIDAG